MLRIERMRMRLPEGFAHRVPALTRLVGDSLAELHLTENLTLDRLSIGPVRVSPNDTDQAIALRVAERIAATLRRGV